MQQWRGVEDTPDNAADNTVQSSALDNRTAKCGFGDTSEHARVVQKATACSEVSHGPSGGSGSKKVLQDNQAPSHQP